MKRTRLFWSIVLLVAVAAPVIACSVPVCRYALERWQPDAYELVVFHRDNLSTEHLALFDRIRPDKTTGRMSTNVRLRLVDVADGDVPPNLADAWKTCEDATLPHVVVRFPDYRMSPEGIWHAPLSAESLSQVLDSPMRRKIGMEIIGGASAAWILLESSDEEQNKAALEMMQEQLGVMEQDLELSKPDASDIASGLISIDPDQMELKFSLLRLSRNDPNEKFLVESLLRTEDDLLDEEFADAPMAFPVFGRGRALFALVGRGITEENIEEACEFLVGPCSCQVKEQNPGTDLLLSIDWDGLVNDTIDLEKPLPELAGLGGFTGDTDDSDEASESDQLVAAVDETNGNAAATAEVSDATEPAVTAVDTRVLPDSSNATADSGEASDSSATVAQAASDDGTRSILQNLGILAAVAAFVVILASVVIVRTRS